MAAETKILSEEQFLDANVTGSNFYTQRDEYKSGRMSDTIKESIRTWEKTGDGDWINKATGQPLGNQNGIREALDALKAVEAAEATDGVEDGTEGKEGGRKRRKKRRKSKRKSKRKTKRRRKSKKRRKTKRKTKRKRRRRKR